MGNDVMYDREEDMFYVTCPHCALYCQIPSAEINCKIFRHAVMKSTMAFVDPHASKEVCDKWVEDGVVWGCGRPFWFDGVTIEACGYI